MAGAEGTVENMVVKYSITTNCSLCNSQNLAEVLYLGKTPIANTYINEDELNSFDEAIPLTLLFCNNCGFLQLKEIVSAERLFTSKDYLYYSSFSKTTITHAKNLVDYLIKNNMVQSNDLVVEIASNDGYLLRFFMEKKFNVLGIEPAKNVAKVAQQTYNIPTIIDFFSSNLAKKLVSNGISADIIIANNVIAHTPHINDFVSGIYTLLKNTGIAIVEIPYFKNIVDNLCFDMIYHEHMYYYTVTTLNKLFSKNGLFMQKVEQTSVQGGSLRVWATKTPQNKFFTQQDRMSIHSLLEEERKLEVSKIQYYRRFANKLEGFKDKLKDFLNSVVSSNNKIAGYGAAAKAFTFLSFCGIGADIIDFIVDKNTYKQGKYIAGINIPIYNPVELLNRLPKYTLLLAWNYVDEVVKEQNEYLKSGGAFIVPLPELKIIRI